MIFMVICSFLLGAAICFLIMRVLNRKPKKSDGTIIINGDAMNVRLYLPLGTLVERTSVNMDVILGEDFREINEVSNREREVK